MISMLLYVVSQVDEDHPNTVKFNKVILLKYEKDMRKSSCNKSLLTDCQHWWFTA